MKVWICGAPSHRTPLARILRRTLGDVEQCQGLAELQTGPELPVLAIHLEGLSTEVRRELLDGVCRSSDRPLVLVLSKPLEPAELAQLLSHHALMHMLIIQSSGVDASDLLTTIRKIQSRQLFGLDKYFRWGVATQLTTIHSSHQRAGALQEVDDCAADLGITSRLRALLAVVSDEFITNALYNAPVNSDGAYRYASRSRTLPVQLHLRHALELRFCCDGERFGLSLTDPFGSLSADRVQDVLARGFRRGSDQVASTSGGAGVGLYRTLDSVTHLAINIEPGRRTELVGLLDVRGSYRTFASRGKSLNLFVLETRR